MLAVVLAGAGLAASLSTVLAASYLRSVGESANIAALAIVNGTFWYGWVLLAVPLVVLSRRWRLDQNSYLAVPVHIAALLIAAVCHVALQSGAQVVVMWQRYSASRQPVETFDWTAEFAAIFPLQLTRLIDWELLAAAAIVGIAHAFFYYRETQQGALREAQLETNLVEARLQVLQRQLQPHFLFNTLHAISALMHRDVHAANRMLVKLSDLLRLTLDSSDRSEFRLAEELEFLEKYLQIEQARLGDRLDVVLDIQPDTLDAVVPALVLQPLVENAVKHGIAPHGEPGRVTVTSRRDGARLILTVTDTGPGPSDGQLVELSTGIGVANTRARLEHQFGDDFRFDLRRNDDGFTVLVAIPFRPEAGQPDEPREAHVA